MEDKHAYNTAYQKDHYDRLSVLFPKGTTKQIKLYAVEHDTSISKLIINALETVYGMDFTKKD